MEEVTEETRVAERERKQFEKMTKTPIPKLVISLGIPTMLSMMVTSLYNLADTYFVSLIGEDAVTAAVSNLLALMSIIQAIGFTYGMGSGAIISKLLGKRDRKSADEVASLLSASRQGLFYIPAVLILPRAFGLLGVQSCQAVTDFCAFFFAIPFTLAFFKKLRAEQAKVGVLSAEGEGQVCDEMNIMKN